MVLPGTRHPEPTEARVTSILPVACFSINVYLSPFPPACHDPALDSNRLRGFGFFSKKELIPALAL